MLTSIYIRYILLLMFNSEGRGPREQFKNAERNRFSADDFSHSDRRYPEGG